MSVNRSTMLSRITTWGNLSWRSSDSRWEETDVHTIFWANGHTRRHISCRYMALITSARSLLLFAIVTWTSRDNCHPTFYSVTTTWRPNVTVGLPRDIITPELFLVPPGSRVTPYYLIILLCYGHVQFLQILQLLHCRRYDRDEWHI